MILLFFSCFIKKFKPLSSKILILALAISPGLSFYSVVVQNLSEEASISFGSEYLIKLNEKIKAIKVEKSELMQEHAQAINHINNGDKGVVFFKKLKEDVSYDLKKSSVSIKGDYSNIRLLMHKGGHEISKKLFTFGTMILFCLFILPIGYSFLVYVFYKHLFFNAAPSEKMEGVAVNTRTGLEDQPNLFNKLGSAVATAKNDQKMPSNLIKSSVRGVVSKKKKDVEHALAQKIDSTKQIVKDDVSTLANQVVYGENKRDKDIGTKLIQEISLEKHHIEEIENQLHQKLKAKANEMKKDISNDTAKLMGEAKEKKHNLNKPWMNRINMGRIDN
jgi:hypothetical protein